ncbi:MAG: hypothetical protein RSB55_07685 [Oscillospiraceae bacterium]
MEKNSLDPCGCGEVGETCTTVSTQCADVSVPIKLRPFASVGEIQTECCGEAVLTSRSVTPNSCGCCELLITQAVCVHIPVAYGASAEVGDTSVLCKRSRSCGETSGR